MCDNECSFTHNRTQEHIYNHVSNGKYTAISIKDIGLLPSRDMFLNKGLQQSVARLIAEVRPLIFMPTSVEDRTVFEGANRIYQICVFGVLPCGSKTCVILKNIPVIFTIKVPPDYTTSDFNSYIRSHMTSKGAFYKSCEVVSKYPMHGFQKDPSDYIKFTFNNMSDRNNFIKQVEYLSKLRINSKLTPLETVDDDASKDYFLKLARDYRFRTGSWNRIEKYTVAPGSKCKYTLSVDIKDYKKLTKSKRKEIAASSPLIAEVLDKDPTCVMVWDIETYRTIQNGQVPTKNDTDFTIFMICAAFFWQSSSEPFMKVCFVNTGMDYICRHDGVLLTVHCDDDLSVVKGFIHAISALKPDITAAYNGGCFDMPLVAEVLRRNDCLLWAYEMISMLPKQYYMIEAKMYRSMFRTAKIKIDAESSRELDCVFNIPGILDVDVLPIFLKLYPRAEVRVEFSLNYFLMRNQIELKEDMPYKVMFKIYERALKYKSGLKECHCDSTIACATCNDLVPEIDCIPIGKTSDGLGIEYGTELHPDIVGKCCYCGKRKRNIRDMSLVGYYCTVDCIRPQQLLVKRTIFMDRRELCTMSFTTLRNSFYNADGMRVRNLLGTYCNKFNIAFSNARCHKTPEQKNHFPGAWVFPPVRGLNNKRPVTGLDFSSLYPSIMMAFNLSPDMLVLDPEFAKALIAEGYSLYQIVSFTYETGEKKGTVGNKIETAEGWTVRHNGILKPADKNIIAGYTKYTLLTATVDGQQVTIKYRSDDPIPTDIMENLTTMEASGVKFKTTYSREPTYGRPALKQERMGLFSYVVKKLFDKRVPVKRQFVQLEHLIEKLEKEHLDSCEYKDEDGAVTTLSLHEMEFRKNKVNAKQYAIKILANTFYGESGNYLSPVYNLHIAGGITSAGQYNIKKVAGFVTGMDYGVQYGDSVTGDTPVLCRFPSGDIFYVPIDQLTTTWDQYGDKEASELTDISVWTETGWTRINRVIRHRTDKEIFRVLTHTGCVDVTSDHSLLNASGEKIKPTEVVVGTELLHSDLPHNTYDTGINPLEAYSMGLFWADGSCGKYGVKYSWAINNQNLDFLHRAKRELEQVLGMDFKILDTMESSHVYKLVPVGDIKTITMRYRELFYNEKLDINGKAYKHIPREILNAPVEVKRLFIEGYYDGDGDKDKHGYVRADNRGKIGSAGLYHLFNEIGYNVSISDDKPDICRLTCTTKKQRRNPSKIKKIQSLGRTEQYVYDLETENHHFAAGIGRMIVHNTDSLYLTCPDKYYSVVDTEYNESEKTTENRLKYWEAMVAITMKVMSNLVEDVIDFLLADNGTLFLKMAYEEVGFPTVLCGKKKYYMTPHQNEINFKPKDVFIRGIEVIKQGQTKIAKELGDEFMRESLAPENTRDLIEIAHDKMRKFYSCDWDITKFVLYGRYKPAKKNVSIQTFAARMRILQAKYKNDPALYALYAPPDPGDRFPYVIVHVDQRYTLNGKMIKINKGDKMEYLSVYLASQKTASPLKIDLNYYMEGSILGLFARFIAYYHEFQPPAGSYNTADKDQYKSMDKYCIGKAVAYLTRFCNAITGTDTTLRAKVGREIRKQYNQIDKAISQDLVERYGPAGELLILVDRYRPEESTKAVSTEVVDKIIELARGDIICDEVFGQMLLQYMEEKGISVHTLKRIYATGTKALGVQMINMSMSIINDIRNQMFTKVNTLVGILIKHEKSFMSLLEDINVDKSAVPEDEIALINTFTSEETEIIRAMYKWFNILRANYQLIAQMKGVMSQIEIARATIIGVQQPTITSQSIATEITNTPLLPDYVWQ